MPRALARGAKLSARVDIERNMPRKMMRASKQQKGVRMSTPYSDWVDQIEHHYTTQLLDAQLELLANHINWDAVADEHITRENRHLFPSPVDGLLYVTQPQARQL